MAVVDHHVQVWWLLTGWQEDGVMRFQQAVERAQSRDGRNMVCTLNDLSFSFLSVVRNL